MELVHAEKIARNLMAKHGLSEAGWSFKFDEATSRLGLTRYKAKIISISRHMTLAADEELVTQTLLHELAHALLPIFDSNGRKVGHGPIWKNKAKSIGYVGGRTSANPYTSTPKVQVHYTNLTTASAFKMLPLKTMVRLPSGRVGEIVKIGRSRYQVRTSTGEVRVCSFSGVTEIVSGLEAARLPVKTSLTLVKGDIVITVLPAGRTSKYAGLTGRIDSVTSKNYKIILAHGGRLTVPHEFAIKA